jgi:hypothetical protein
LVDGVFHDLLAKNGLHGDEAASILGAVRCADDLLSIAQSLTAITDDIDVVQIVAARLYARAPDRSPLLSAVADSIEAAIPFQRAAGVQPTVLTFNYDTLLEDELVSRGIAVESVDRAVHGASGKLGAVCVVHAHGTVSDKTSSKDAIVFSEESYGDAYLRDGGVDPLSELLMADALPLFVGFSFQDRFVRQVLQRASLRRKGPVAVGLLAKRDVVDVRGPMVSGEAMRGFTPNDQAGWRKTGHNPIHARQETISKVPEHFARWILHTIGVEWWSVADWDNLPAALKMIGPKRGEPLDSDR